MCLIGILGRDKTRVSEHVNVAACARGMIGPGCNWFNRRFAVYNNNICAVFFRSPGSARDKRGRNMRKLNSAEKPDSIQFCRGFQTIDRFNKEV